jgi:hypothetical protein
MSQEFSLHAYDGTRGSHGPMTVTIDGLEIRWTSPKTSGRLTYDEIVSIELILGDPDGDERDDICTISTGAGLALRVHCEVDRSWRATKFRPLRREAYSNFIRLLHQQLSPEDRRRIAFKTDGKLTNKAQWFFVGGWLVSSVAVIVLLIAIGHPMELGLGWSFVQVVYGITIYKLFPKEPRTYCPDPIDEIFLPR